MKYYLNIQEKLTVEQTMSAIVPESINIEFSSEQECIDAKEGIINFLFSTKETISKVHICGHEDNIACQEYEI